MMMMGSHSVQAVILVLATLADHLDKSPRPSSREMCNKAAAIVRKAVEEMKEI